MAERMTKMPSNNSKYTQEIREQTARYIPENGRSATCKRRRKPLQKRFGKYFEAKNK